MTTFRCPSDILITSWLFIARWSTWPGNHLVPHVAVLVWSCIPIHAPRCLPDPKCLFGLSLCLSVDHFCLVPVDDMVLFHGMVCDGWLEKVSHHRPCRGREPCHRLGQGKSGRLNPLKCSWTAAAQAHTHTHTHTHFMLVGANSTRQVCYCAMSRSHAIVTVCRRFVCEQDTNAFTDVNQTQ